MKILKSVENNFLECADEEVKHSDYDIANLAKSVTGRGNGVEMD